MIHFQLRNDTRKITLNVDVKGQRFLILLFLLPNNVTLLVKHILKSYFKFEYIPMYTKDLS